MNNAPDLQPIVPALKGFDCVEHDPIDAWRPTSDRIHYYLTLRIGSPDSDAADLYKVAVCTPRGLATAKQSGVARGAAPPIVLTVYSWQSVLDSVHSRLSACSGFGWLDVQEKLRKHFVWEYEGYK